MEIRLRHRKGRMVEYLDNGKWKSTGKNNKRDAKTWVETRDMQTPDTIFSDFAKDMFTDDSPGSYMSIRKDSGNDLANITWSNYAYMLDSYIMPFFGSYKMKDINPRLIQTWYIGLKKSDGKRPLAPTTRHDILNVLSVIMDHAIFAGIIQFNPCKSVIKSKSIPTIEKKAFTDEEISRLFPDDDFELMRIWKSNLHDACYFMVMRDTGWRPGEVAAMTPSSLVAPEIGGVYTENAVDPKIKEVKNTIKTSDHGYEYKLGILSKRTTVIFLRLCSDLEDNELVFKSKSGEALSSTCMYSRFRKALDRAGISREGHPPYALRTTFFTNTAQTENDSVAMRLMGHTQWHSCYDKRSPADMIRKAFSELSDGYRREKLDRDIIRREG